MGFLGGPVVVCDGGVLSRDGPGWGLQPVAAAALLHAGSVALAAEGGYCLLAFLGVAGAVAGL